MVYQYNRFGHHTKWELERLCFSIYFTSVVNTHIDVIGAICPLAKSLSWVMHRRLKYNVIKHHYVNWQSPLEHRSRLSTHCACSVTIPGACSVRLKFLSRFSMVLSIGSCSYSWNFTVLLLLNVCIWLYIYIYIIYLEYVFYIIKRQISLVN
mgnify:CR=1 FL=1